MHTNIIRRKKCIAESFLKWLAVLPNDFIWFFKKSKATSEPKEDCVPDVISSPDVSVMVEISHRPNDSVWCVLS